MRELPSSRPHGSFMASASQIIFIPLPAQGHVAPMLHLATILASEGFTITVINTDSIHESLQKNWRSSPGLDFRFEVLPLGPNDGTIFSMAQALIRTQQPLAELITSIHLRGPRVTCVISDFFHHSAARATQQAGLPSAGLFCGMGAWASIDIFTSKIILNGDMPIKDGDDKLITYLPGLEIRSVDMPHYLQERDYSKEGLETLLYRLERLKIDSWILITTVHEFEVEVLDAIGKELDTPLIPIGPLFPAKGMSMVSLKKEDGTCLEWLENRAPSSVLYISFGSMAVLSPDQFKELALGVEESGQSFLWINRSVSASEKDEEFYTSFIERTKERGLVVEWCPQLKVLQHKSTGAFLTHAGWNSVMESITSGVPMIAYPFVLDQKLNAKLLLEEKGVGVCLEQDANNMVAKDEIVRKIKEVMEDTGDGMNKFREKARELSETAMDAIKICGSSHKNLEDFVSDLKTT